ncbi:glycosyltransferase [Opitutaceae bacterium EW11]|nr:glycosyltransferase [Opitutaceae bacterium EW11]
MFSVVILTLNEERNLPGCLSSAFSASDDVVVLDSGSTDRTKELARGAGARVAVHAFENFGAQRNHADHAIEYRHPWVFHLDADERFTPELIAECQARSEENPADVDGFWVAPKMYFRNRWIRHCTDFPAYQARFVSPQRFQFVQFGHGQREHPEMRMAKIRANYLHDLSADGDDALLEKHRRYAREEAEQALRSSTTEQLRLSALFASDALVRRRALKTLSHRLPARGSLRFLYQYGLRGGFLDGRPGFAYCRLLARYEKWVADEIRRQRHSK